VIVDTHCHLNFNLFHDDLLDVLARARDCGVVRIIIPAIDVASSLEAIELSHKYSEIYAAVGIHPNDASGFTLRDIDKLHDLTSDPRVIAIGEIGLDKYHDDVELAVQIAAFEAQLDLARSVHLPVLVHNREADEEMGNVLVKWFSNKADKDAGILHAFSSSLDFARDAVAMGFSLGFGGPVTYKSAESKRQVLREINHERVVIETDAPFLSPQPKRGKRNEPAFTVFIAEEIARIWTTTIDEVMELTTQNAARIFQWNNMN
jgi:TatD DNase family protein